MWRDGEGKCPGAEITGIGKVQAIILCKMTSLRAGI
jgi:hypothetical protein